MLLPPLARVLESDFNCEMPDMYFCFSSLIHIYVYAIPQLIVHLVLSLGILCLCMYIISKDVFTYLASKIDSDVNLVNSQQNPVFS